MVFLAAFLIMRIFCLIYPDNFGFVAFQKLCVRVSIDVRVHAYARTYTKYSSHEWGNTNLPGFKLLYKEWASLTFCLFFQATTKHKEITVIWFIESKLDQRVEKQSLQRNGWALEETKCRLDMRKEWGTLALGPLGPDPLGSEGKEAPEGRHMLTVVHGHPRSPQEGTGAHLLKYPHDPLPSEKD